MTEEGLRIWTAVGACALCSFIASFAGTWVFLAIF
jgi:hypothetical protein